MGHRQKIPDADLEKIKDLHLNQGKSWKDIAELYDVGKSSIGRYLKKHGVKSVPPGGRNKIDPGKDILAQDIENGLTNRQIAIKYVAGIQAVCNWMHKYGFNVNRDVFRYDQFIPESELRQLAEVERKTDREIAKMFDVRFQTIHVLRKRWGIKNYTIPENPGYDVLYDLYITQELNQIQIANKLGISRPTVASWLAKCSIRKRTRPEQIDVALQQGKWNDTASKARYTQMINRLLKGSAPQQAMVIALITGLEPLHNKGWEIVIGQQNWCILEGTAEVDIPVLVMRDENVVKIAVEVDGIYWHANKDPFIKDWRLRERNWIPFHYSALAGKVENQFPAMQSFVSEIRQYILDS